MLSGLHLAVWVSPNAGRCHLFITSSTPGLKNIAICADQTQSTIECRGGENRSEGPIIMDKEPTIQHWLIKATAFLQRVARAKGRFSTSVRVNEVTMLAAADELQVATWDATLWMAVNACPDVELGQRLALMLNTYAEVALTAQRAITDPSADTDAVIGRLEDLLALIDLQSQILDAR